MFVKICSVSRSFFLRQSHLTMATLAQMSVPSGDPGPVESSILDKVPVYVAICIAFTRPSSDNPASSPASSNPRDS